MIISTLHVLIIFLLAQVTSQTVSTEHVMDSHICALFGLWAMVDCYNNYALFCVFHTLDKVLNLVNSTYLTDT